MDSATAATINPEKHAENRRICSAALEKITEIPAAAWLAIEAITHPCALTPASIEEDAALFLFSLGLCDIDDEISPTAAGVLVASLGRSLLAVELERMRLAIKLSEQAPKA